MMGQHQVLARLVRRSCLGTLAVRGLTKGRKMGRQCTVLYSAASRGGSLFTLDFYCTLSSRVQ